MLAKIETVKHIYGIDTGFISYIVRTAQLFKSIIIIENMITGKRANARKLKELFNLCTTYDTDVKIEATGEDEEDAVEAMSNTFHLFAERKIFDSKDVDERIEKAYLKLEEDIMARREKINNKDE
ncbi:MAG: HPr family phosphocarrier protein [Spirochaetales bacterium]|nr:HPr family phosphocarrier protein [Spirochaetales bacterium]